MPEKAALRREKAALLIIDMVKDNVFPQKELPITAYAKQIIEPINNLAAEFRSRGFPVIYSTDSFRQEDFIFKGRMPPHSLAGTEGAELIDELDRQPEDLWLPKPRFSAFFATGLEDTLRSKGVTICAVGGIATNYCVLMTAMDSLCNDFKTVILEDCSAAFKPEIHEATLDLYRKNPLYPLFQIIDSREFLRKIDDPAQSWEAGS